MDRATVEQFLRIVGQIASGALASAGYVTGEGTMLVGGAVSSVGLLIWWLVWWSKQPATVTPTI